MYESLNYTTCFWIFKTILFTYDQPVYNIRNYYFVGKPVQCTLCYHYDDFYKLGSPQER